MHVIKLTVDQSESWKISFLVGTVAPKVAVVEYVILKLGRNVTISFLVLSKLLQMPIYFFFSL